MKKVLIIGKNSYIGKSLVNWVNKNYIEEIQITSVGAKNSEWKQVELKDYDTILHLAAVVHSSEKKVPADLYFKVNTELSYWIAEKAKKHDIKQFIYMSTMAVYGIQGSLKEKVTINSESLCHPTSLYGISKYKGEQKINLLSTKDFKVAIIRPPMIYGLDCPGNYSRLSKAISIMKLFPAINNERSMIYIDNLCEFICNVIKNNKEGVFHPQNKEYVETTELISEMSNARNKKVYTSTIIGKLIKKIMWRNSNIIKLYGNLVYDKKLSERDDIEYCVVDFKESIKLSEKRKW